MELIGLPRVAAALLLSLGACGRTGLLVEVSEGSSGSSSSGSSEAPSADTTTLDSSTSEDTTTLDPETTSEPPLQCGNGIVEAGEECDDGNDDDGDACTSVCVQASCGDGVVWRGVEECDDADTDDEDDCHTNCTRSRVTALALGGNHSCARLDNGSVRCWGNGNNGRTGHGHAESIGDDEPALVADVLDLDGPVEEIAAGLSHTCVRYDSGSIRCFGRAAEGQLGYGNVLDIGDDETPAMVATVPLGPADLIATGSGSFHGCIRRVDGLVRCWGAAGSGRLGTPGVSEAIGDDEPAFSAPPVDVGGLVMEIVTGVEHTCARISDGSVRCWGSNTSGQLGRGLPETIGDDETPASAGPVPIGGRVQQLAAGFFHTCALLDEGTVRCWGRGNNGRLGYGNTAWVGINDTPLEVGTIDLGGEAVQIAAGNAHTCARLTTGALRCWGWAAQGQLGYGNLEDIGDDEAPATVGDVPLGTSAVEIAAAGNHTCAVIDTGRVRCWGNGGDGRLGYGNAETIGDDETPASVGDVPLWLP